MQADEIVGNRAWKRGGGGAEGGMDDAIEWIIHRQRKTEALHFY